MDIKIKRKVFAVELSEEKYRRADEMYKMLYHLGRIQRPMKKDMIEHYLLDRVYEKILADYKEMQDRVNKPQ
jgi:hypothetical protein